ncbi:MAG: peptidoglycan editing factor PgeF [Thermodesulfobacteriota bacterium]|nr:peptidoglycan editing factor PgeF [Thermodesulfobacteriota bacterium]
MKPADIPQVFLLPMIQKIPSAKFSYLTFANLAQQKLSHGVFLRAGGVSPPPYNSLNISYHVGDQHKNIQKNRQKILAALAMPFLVSSKQVHGKKIHQVTETPTKTESEVDGYDGLLTDVPGVALMIQQADCQAVLLYDPIRPAVANIHVGWRGSVADIINETIRIMKKSYNTRAENLLAAISPSLGSCCAEFVNFRRELPRSLHGYQTRQNFFDFPAISRDQLTGAGVLAKNIETAGICTKCDPNFFSYRRETTTGRSCSVIGLR